MTHIYLTVPCLSDSECRRQLTHFQTSNLPGISTQTPKFCLCHTPKHPPLLSLSLIGSLSMPRTNPYRGVWILHPHSVAMPHARFIQPQLSTCSPGPTSNCSLSHVHPLCLLRWHFPIHVQIRCDNSHLLKKKHLHSPLPQ